MASGDTTLIGIALFAPNVLTQRLEKLVPFAVSVGLKDMLRTIKADVLARTPVGWVYIPAKVNKKGKKRTDQAGKGKWVKSSSASGKKAAGAGIAKSWRTGIEQDSFFIGTDMPYAFMLEDGRYPNPPKGPLPTGKPWDKGWRVEGGFSKQAQGGLLQPIYDDDTYLQGAVGLIAERIIQQFNG